MGASTALDRKYTPLKTREIGKCERGLAGGCRGRICVRTWPIDTRWGHSPMYLCERHVGEREGPHRTYAPEQWMYADLPGAT